MCRSKLVCYPVFIKKANLAKIPVKCVTARSRESYSASPACPTAQRWIFTLLKFQLLQISPKPLSIPKN